MKKTLTVIIILYFVTTSQILAQSSFVSGIIFDRDGEAQIGCTVINTEKQEQVYSDMDGFYKIEAGKGDKISYSYLGMITKDVVVKRDTYNVLLDEDTQNSLYESLDVKDYLLNKKKNKGDKYSVVNNAKCIINGDTVLLADAYIADKKDIGYIKVVRYALCGNPVVLQESRISKVIVVTGQPQNWEDYEKDYGYKNFILKQKNIEDYSLDYLIRKNVELLEKWNQQCLKASSFYVLGDYFNFYQPFVEYAPNKDKEYEYKLYMFFKFMEQKGSGIPLVYKLLSVRNTSV